MNVGRCFALGSSLVLCLISLGCDRLKLGGSQVSLQIPQTLSGNESASSVDVSLKHIVVQITASDMANAISIIYDADGNAGIPAEITVDVPTGSGRLIQVLAAYASPGVDQSETLFYGDVVKTLNGGIETVSIPLTSLSSGVEEQGRMIGRFLTAPNAGPTGELKMVYRPVGKPAVVVDKKPMVSGWFEATMFSTVPMDYILPDGSLMGEQWRVGTMTTGPHLVRLHLPANNRREYNIGQLSWKSQEVESKFYGYFSRDAGFLTDKKVCVQSASPVGGGSLFLANNFLGQNLLRPVPLKVFHHGNTSQISPSFASLIGGVTEGACAALNANDEFKNYMRIISNSPDGMIYQNFEDTVGLRGLNAAFVRGLSGVGSPVYRNLSYSGGDQTGPYLEIRVLPGVREQVTEFQVYARSMVYMPTMGANSERCESARMAEKGWQLMASNLLPSASGGYIKIYQSDLKIAPNSTQSYAICLAQSGKPIGNQVEFWSYTFSATPPDRVGVWLQPSNSGTSSLLVNECRGVDIYLTNSAGGVYNPLPSLAVTLAATNSGGSPEAVLYSDSSCLSTGQSTLAQNIEAPNTAARAYIKVSSADNYNIIAQSNTGGLNMDPPYVVNAVVSPGSANEIQVGGDGLFFNSNINNLYPGGCFPIRVMALNNSVPANVSGSVTLEWKRLDGTSTYTPPAGVSFVNNCTAKSPISPSLTFSGTSAKTFGIVVGNQAVTNAILKVSGWGVSKESVVNIAPLVHHFSINLPSGSVPNPALGVCQAVEIHARDINNAVVTIASQDKVYLNVWANSTTPQNSTVWPDIRIFSDPSCSFNTANIEIVGGQSSKTVYMQAITAVPGYLTYSSQSAEVTANGDQDTINRTLIQPVP